MFDLFKYFVYVVRGSLDYFDPVTDMLVDSGTYLTWRRYNDEVATHGVPYAGAIKDTQLDRWVILRFNRRLFYEGVEDWLETQAKGLHTLGVYKPSKFKGLLREKPPYADIDLESWHAHKLPLAEDFFRKHWGDWPTWLIHELDSRKSPTQKWEHVRDWLVGMLSGERGVA